MPKIAPTPAPAPSGNARGSSRPLTSFEYLLAQCFGWPRCVSDTVGLSYWLCPNCKEDSFHSLPHDPNEKDRAICKRNCGLRGDAFDMLLQRYPKEDYGMRKWRVANLQYKFEEYLEEYKQQRGANLTLGGGAGSTKVTPC